MAVGTGGKQARTRTAGKKRGRIQRLAKLDEETLRRFTGSLRLGVPFDVSCHLAPLAVRSVREWIKKGKEDDRLDLDTPSRQFWIVVRKALAEAEARDWMLIGKAAELPQYWQAAAWRLERRFPRHFGRWRLSVKPKGTDHPETAPQEIVLFGDKVIRF